MSADFDLVDRIIEQWRREKPSLDVSALSIVSRVIMLAQRLERLADAELQPLDLSLSQLDVLAALRRVGPPYALTPTQLLRSVVLTSGAMTNRIDRLEQKGLVRRSLDPDDRRGFIVSLTPEGRRITDVAMKVRLAQSDSLLRSLSRRDRKGMAQLLRQLLISLENGREPAGRANGRPSPISLNEHR